MKHEEALASLAFLSHSKMGTLCHLVTRNGPQGTSKMERKELPTVAGGGDILRFLAILQDDELRGEQGGPFEPLCFEKVMGPDWNLGLCR